MTKQKFKVILVHDDTHYKLMKLKAEHRMSSIDAVIADMILWKKR